MNGLAEAQVRGASCVWCGVVLSNGTAFELGPRQLRFFSTKVNWFPRCCPACAKGHDILPTTERGTS
jgi:hypothetical protein